MAGLPHLRWITLGATLRKWVDSLPQLDSGTFDTDGNPLPFDKSLIFPYAFRHSFAQRHADAGTPLDVLRDLMDHDDSRTTLGYYRNPRELHQTGEKSPVARSGTCLVGDLSSYNLAA